MSRVPGISLREWMNKNMKDELKSKDVFVRVKIVEQLCEIMRTLSAKNVWLVHRDLKPENIFIDFNNLNKKWDIYIIDFGCANLNYVRGVGTTSYQAPEQIGIKEAGVKINSTIDVFAIGQIFYELLLGWVPVIGKEYTYKLKEIDWIDIPRLPNYLFQMNGMSSLYEIIKKMTVLKSENRLAYGRIITMLKNVRIG